MSCPESVQRGVRSLCGEYLLPSVIRAATLYSMLAKVLRP